MRIRWKRVLHSWKIYRSDERRNHNTNRKKLKDVLKAAGQLGKRNRALYCISAPERYAPARIFVFFRRLL